jgi:hypothetical protein
VLVRQGLCRKCLGLLRQCEECEEADDEVISIRVRCCLKGICVARSSAVAMGV